MAYEWIFKTDYRLHLTTIWFFYTRTSKSRKYCLRRNGDSVLMQVFRHKSVLFYTIKFFSEWHSGNGVTDSTFRLRVIMKVCFYIDIIINLKAVVVMLWIIVFLLVINVITICYHIIKGEFILRNVCSKTTRMSEKPIVFILTCVFVI